LKGGDQKNGTRVGIPSRPVGSMKRQRGRALQPLMHSRGQTNSRVVEQCRRRKNQNVEKVLKSQGGGKVGQPFQPPNRSHTRRGEKLGRIKGERGRGGILLLA